MAREGFTEVIKENVRFRCLGVWSSGLIDPLK